MQALDQKYKTVLDNIKSSIQLSEELKVYLDTEEDDDYKALVAKFENQIHESYTQVANDHPLQLVAFEEYLLDEQFEGLYLPKTLGYAVLRGKVNEHIKYTRPQNHFAKILNFIINSSNFEQIKQRVGQSIQIGFALSSDIWITNLLATITNKRVKAFLESQKQNGYRDQKLRNTGLVKYRKQFQSLNFACAKFPQDSTELLVEAASLKDFLIYRGLGAFNNDNLSPSIKEFLANDSLAGNAEFFELSLVLGLHFDHNDENLSLLKKSVSSYRNALSNDSEEIFPLIIHHSNRVGGLTIEQEKRLSKVIDRDIQDNLSKYFNMLDTVLTHGYINETAINAVREYYYKNEGLSLQNEAVRKSILAKFDGLLSNLPHEDYNEYFEINKIFTQYMEIFSNQKFNQELKELSLKYVRKCLKNYKDKRSKEYQDIKKFVKSTFIDYGFMTEKQVTELFKTKRKPKTV